MNVQMMGMVSLALAALGCGGNSITNKGYIGLFADGMVAVFDTMTYQVLDKIPVTAPDGMAITPDGTKVYVSSANSGSVDVIDTTKDVVTTTIPVGTMPQGMSITPDGTRVIVAVQTDGKVVEIDTSTDTVVGQASLGTPHSSIVGPDGKTAYVGSQATGATAVALLNTSNGTIGQTFPVDKAPRPGIRSTSPRSVLMRLK